MILALQAAYARIHNTLTRITPASWLFNFLGVLIVAKPEEMQQSPDFWLDNEERRLPSSNDYGLPKIQMQQVASEHFRRGLRKDIAVLSTIAAMILCSVIYIAALIGIWAITPGSGAMPVIPAAAGSHQSADKKKPAARADGPQVTTENCQRFRANLAKVGPGLLESDKQVQSFSTACANQLGI